MTDEIYSCDLYLGQPELTAEQCDAIEVLCGLHPRLIGEGPRSQSSGDEGDYGEDDYGEEEGVPLDPRQRALLFALVNLVKFAEAEPFQQNSLEAFADLTTFGDFLGDMCTLLTKVARPDPRSLITAAVAASMITDTLGRGQAFEVFISDWDEMIENAQGLVDRLLKVNGKQ